MHEKIYQYPDFEDKITAEMIRKNELYPRYWQDSENYILDLIKQLIKNNIISRGSRFLDAGCGEGRMLPVFEDLFENIMAIDPDDKRLKAAEKIAEDMGFHDKTTFVPIDIDNLDEKIKFDFILCGHILQHVNTESVQKIIKKFSKILAKKGILCIITCHSTKERDYFVKDFFSNSQFFEELITKDEFNSLVNCSGVLPIHFFAFCEISRLLNINGFKIIDYKVFHLTEKSLSSEIKKNIDTEVNSNPDLQAKAGRDMLIVAVLSDMGGASQ